MTDTTDPEHATPDDDGPGPDTPGAPSGSQAPPDPDGPKKLLRSRSERMVAGVCGGLAKYMDLDPTIVRLGYVILTIVTGFVWGIIGYVVAVVIVPEE